MALYPESADDVRIDPAILTAIVAAIFEACGMEDADARLLSDSLVRSDLRGVHSHGVIRVPDYVGKLRNEGVDPRGRPRIASEKGAAIVVDGGNAMGQIALGYAMERAIGRAREVGVAFAAVGGSNHCGALDYFAMMASDAGMVGLVGTNALPTMAPWGGVDKIVGINPMAIAIPGGREGAFVLDCAFGETAHGKIRVYAQKGAPIPEGWAFDAEGRPTTDAVAALSGLIRPIGSHKGVGFGMAIGMLSTLLSGAGYGTRLGNMVDGPIAGRDGHFALAIDIAAFTDLPAFTAAVDDVLDEVRSSRRADGCARLLTPGEMEAERAAVQQHDGIVLAGETLAGVSGCGRDLGVDVTRLEQLIQHAAHRS